MTGKISECVCWDVACRGNSSFVVLHHHRAGGIGSLAPVFDPLSGRTTDCTRPAIPSPRARGSAASKHRDDRLVRLLLLALLLVLVVVFIVHLCFRGAGQSTC